MKKTQSNSELKQERFLSFGGDIFKNKAELNGFQVNLFDMDDNDNYFHIHLSKDNYKITSQCDISDNREPYAIRVFVNDTFYLELEWNELKIVINDFDTMVKNIEVFRNQIDALKDLSSYIEACTQDLRQIILYRTLSKGNHREALVKYKSVLIETENILSDLGYEN